MKETINPTEAAHRALTYRKAAGLSQRQLAEKLNTTRGVIGALEMGKVRSRRVALLALDLVPESAEGLI